MLGILLGGILTIQCFCHAADKFSNRGQMKISIYIKPEFKKDDTTGMTTAINEACIE